MGMHVPLMPQLRERDGLWCAARRREVCDNAVAGFFTDVSDLEKKLHRAHWAEFHNISPSHNTEKRYPLAR